MGHPPPDHALQAFRALTDGHVPVVAHSPGRVPRRCTADWCVGSWPSEGAGGVCARPTRWDISAGRVDPDVMPDAADDCRPGEVGAHQRNTARQAVARRFLARHRGASDGSPGRFPFRNRPRSSGARPRGRSSGTLLLDRSRLNTNVVRTGLERARSNKRVGEAVGRREGPTKHQGLTAPPNCKLLSSSSGRFPAVTSSPRRR